MKIILRSVSVLALVGVFASNMRADQITMKNGDRVTGNIVRKDGASLTIASALFGTITLPWEQVDMQVLLKSDGLPTYHLANVVDDHLMGITHVMRGEEWLMSAPKHILLFEAIGVPLPKFAHLPLILNPDRTKMSKRKSQTAISDYRAEGFLKEAIVNFLALLGWSTGSEDEIRARMTRNTWLYRRIALSDKLIVAAVDGPAYGAGLGLALANAVNDALAPAGRRVELRKPPGTGVDRRERVIAAGVQYHDVHGVIGSGDAADQQPQVDAAVLNVFQGSE